jgi:hypothetical protein
MPEHAWPDGSAGSNGGSGGGGVGVYGCNMNAPGGVAFEFAPFAQNRGGFPNTSVRIVVPHTGNLETFITRIDLNSLAGGGANIRMLLNGVAVSTISYSAGETGIKENAGPFAVTKGQVLSFVCDATPAASGTIEGSAAVKLV